MKKWKNPVLLGKGAFSEVYRVTDLHTGELMVCKISLWMEMARRESEILAQIRHPLFPEYRGSFEDRNGHCLLMEYIPGMHLREYVRKRGRLSQRRAVQIAMALTEGLIYLHELPEPVIFRDIKPENVMIQQNGRVRLVDVGCVHGSGEQMDNMAGSRGYAAPEQFRKGGKIGAESDVYALGKLLYFMLSGQEDNCGKLPGKISPGLRQLIALAVRMEAKERIPDMRAFKQNLSVYEQKGLLRRFREDVKAIPGRKREYTFYYEKNIKKN